MVDVFNHPVTISPRLVDGRAKLAHIYAVEP